MLPGEAALGGPVDATDELTGGAEAVPVCSSPTAPTAAEACAAEEQAEAAGAAAGTGGASHSPFQSASHSSSSSECQRRLGKVVHVARSV